MNELALFAGAGGGILGGHLLGWRTVCAVEIEDYPRRILLQRQADGFLPRFPIWDDICTFDGKPWRGKVDVVSGGFPCQDISIAGGGGGLDGKRSGLWSEMSRVIGEVQPTYAFVENSPMLTIRGLGTVLGNLSQMGYDCKWGVISAADVGANHKRERIWIVGKRQMANARCEYGQKRVSKPREIKPNNTSIISKRHSNEKIWNKEIESTVVRMVDGMASRVDRLKAVGNGQVPLVAATAWRILSEIH